MPPGPPQGYLPIEEHGIVGDLRTVALIGTDGTVDWYCPSRFDAPSLFGALLDARKGGYFSLTSRTGYARPKQLYLPDSNVLLTRFSAEDAIAEVIDFMVSATERPARGGTCTQTGPGVRGRARFEVACRPAFDYGRCQPPCQNVRARGPSFLAAGPRRAPRRRRAQRGGKRVDATFNVEPARRPRSPGLDQRRPPVRHRASVGGVRLTKTPDLCVGRPVTLRRPLARDRAPLCARAQAARVHPTGALVAAPTASLPEDPGGSGTGTTATRGSATPRSRSTP